MKKSSLSIYIGIIIFLFAFINVIYPSFPSSLSFDIHLLHNINMHRIPHFDNFWKFITNISFIISLIIPLWILIYGIRNKVTQIKWKGIFLCITWVLGTIVNVIIKFSVDRERPFYEYPKLVEKLSTGGSPSFPSGHTAEAVSVAIAILLVYSHRKLSSTVVIIWALMVAYSRMCLGVHFPSDVLAGIGIGIFSAGLSLYITERIAKQRI